LKIHKDRVGRHHTLSVARHLAQNEYIPPFNTSISPEQANEHNLKVLHTYNNPVAAAAAAAAVSFKTNHPSPPLPTTTITTTNVPNSSVTEDTKLSKARSVQSLGLLHCRQTWGKVQEAASIYVLMKLFPDSLVCEIGMCRLDTNINSNIAELLKRWGFQDGDLPPLGASPDAMIEHYYYDEGEDEDSSVLMKRLTLKDDKNDNSSSTSSRRRRWKEIVEVKNTCPFYINRVGGGGRGRGRGEGREYILSDQGPRSAVDPLWMPQLQLHMLCADTASGLLLSRSATMGVRVMRVKRDDEYLRLMLGCISALYKRAKEGKYPSAGFYSGTASCTIGRDHKRLVEKTVELARKAKVVVDNDVVLNIHPVGGDDRLFI